MLRFAYVCVWWDFLVSNILAFPVALALIFYQLEPLEPAHLPRQELKGVVAHAPARNDRLLRGSEVIGVGALMAPEDVAYGAEARPLDLAIGHGKQLVIADTEKVMN
ncbi:hypothetical protein TIFTF001_002180 [Ficus carica]|uniref:Uncharacterized protein n=1 Tax=Ficus carica TaxID=3494 RepID=A0AA88CNR7_FICCA|nr:hypothetical protein TIFTF001_002180 [Ficus carica]